MVKISGLGGVLFICLLWTALYIAFRISSFLFDQIKTFSPFYELY